MVAVMVVLRFLPLGAASTLLLPLPWTLPRIMGLQAAGPAAYCEGTSELLPLPALGCVLPTLMFLTGYGVPSYLMPRWQRSHNFQLLQKPQQYPRFSILDNSIPDLQATQI